ncbi:MAG: choice-of-anchor Q domain-containing protein [Deinococcota bacterium]
MTLGWTGSPTVNAVVMNTNDAGPDSLREVITNATSNTIITFDASLAGQTITLLTALPDISVRFLTIDASALSGGVTVARSDAASTPQFRIFNHTRSSGSLTINNLTIQNGSVVGSGGGISGLDDVTLINSTVTGNSASDDGGGIYTSYLFTSVTLTNSTVTGNNAGNNGGGIHTDSFIGIGTAGTVTLTNSLVLGNEASTNPQIRGNVTLNNSAYGFASGESTGDTFVGLTINDVFLNPEPAASAPTTAGDYRLVMGSPAIDAGDDAAAAGISNDLAGNPRIDGAAVDMGAFEGGFARAVVINPNPDIQIRNGNSTSSSSITSNGLVPLSYGTFKRSESVVLEYLVRNPGAQTLTLGELVLPSFMSVEGDTLPESLGSFESALLQVRVDTSVAGTLEGQVSLASNDPDANETPFVFDLIVRISNEPANTLQVLPGITLDDINISPNQQNVPVYSAYLLVPEGSADVTINSLTLSTDDIPALRDVQSLTLLIDGGTRGIQDNRDVILATIDNPTSNTITFEFEERTLQPNLPLWVLVVADF